MTDFATDDALGRALADLGAHLRVPAAPMWTRVAAELDTDRTPARRRRSQILAIAAACLALLLGATLAIAPARRAVANFFGIGSTRIEHVDDHATGVPPFGDVPERTDVDDLRARLARAHLVLLDPDLVGTPRAWQVDPERTTVVVYDDVVLTQRTSASQSIKGVPHTGTVEFTTVAGNPALWIGGPHSRTIDGHVFSSESALVWIDGPLELRLEGDLTLEAMRRIGASASPVR